jgi:hypothetical protein
MYSEFCYHAFVLTQWFALKHYWQGVSSSVRHHVHHLTVVYEIDNKVSVRSNFYSYRPVRSLFYKRHKCLFFSLLNEYELDILHQNYGTY